ncbi:MAG: TonB-dependent receptor domain-containing protein [Longimicrobiales bacterium]
MILGAALQAAWRAWTRRAVPIGPSRQLGRACLLAVGVLGLWAPQLSAQSTGRLSGRVLSEETGEPLQSVELRIEGTATTTTSDLNGRYLLQAVPVGSHTLIVQNLGYATKRITGVLVEAGATASLDVTLAAEAIQLEAVTVTAAAERGTVSRALDQQRTAAGIVNSIVAEQIARHPDSDAAAAVQRVSGVTVQDGKYVFVRGLGERYTTTSLNGARIPSPEPERKLVPFDLFPSGLLESITTLKTFTPDQPGDFSGAQLNIRTRDFVGERQLRLSVSSGYNTAATGQTVPAAPVAGMEWLGFAGDQRRLPPAAREAGDFRSQTLTRDDINRIAGSFRNAWSAGKATGLPNTSLALSLGGTDPLFGRDLNYLGSLTYARSQEIQAEQVRSAALADVGGGAAVASRFAGVTGKTSVLWGGLLNLNTLIGEHTRLELNNTYNRSADNEARTEVGWTENLARLPLYIDRLRYVERSVRSNQLKAEHRIGTQRVAWAVTSSAVERREPDRSEIVYMAEPEPATGEPLPPAWFGGSNEAAVRTFGALTESGLELSADYELALGGADRHRLKLGGAIRDLARDADNRAYSISAPGTLNRAARELPPEQIFDGRYTQNGSAVLNVTPLGAGGSYTADDQLTAGYAMIDLIVAERLRLVAGARVEQSAVTVHASPTSGEPVVTEPSNTDVLPSFALNLRLSERQNLRLSASRTLSRPEYRELAPILYREVIGAENVFGNPDLKRTTIANYDLRWEWYPEAREVLTFGLFAKRFTNPVERVYVAASGTPLVTFVNASGAENFGVEGELRLGLGRVAQRLSSFSAFANLTIMRSSIEIDDPLASKTNDERPMVGQAPYVVNAGVAFAPRDGATSATLLYNVVGDRIVNAAEAPLPDVYEQSRHVIDLSLMHEFPTGMSLKLDGKNLLDSPYEWLQGPVVRERYRVGRIVSLGLAWRL